MKHDDIERLHKAIQHLSDVLLSVHDQIEERALEKGVEDAKSHLRFNPTHEQDLDKQRSMLISALGYLDHHLDFDGLCARVEDVLGESRHGMKLRRQLIHKLKQEYGKNEVSEMDDAGLIQLLSKLELVKPCPHCESHKHNSEQVLLLNRWLQKNNLGDRGSSVTDTVINLLDDAVNLKRKTSEYLKTSFAFTGVTGIHPDAAKLMTEVAEMTGVELRHLGEVQLSKPTPTPPQLINMSRVLNAIHVKHELRGEMTEDRVIENLETLYRDATGNFSSTEKIEMIKKHPVLKEMIYELNTCTLACEMLNSIGDTLGMVECDYSETVNSLKKVKDFISQYEK